MLKTFIFAPFGLTIGIIAGILVTGIIKLPKNINLPTNINVKQTIQPAKKEVWGFLPYWFINKAKDDYSGYVTTLTYFSLSPDSDGTILKYNNPGEFEPGYYALISGSFNDRFNLAKKNNIKLSLTIFSGDQEKIEAMLQNPEKSAENLASEVLPLMNEYGFSDLNVDIESIKEAAPSMQIAFSKFVNVLSQQISTKNYNISIDIAPIDFFKENRLVKPDLIEKYVNKIILMAYDYHSPSSFVTGPVSPLFGAGTIAEFDSDIAVKQALKVTSKEKLILGFPVYGYSWETINDFARSAIIPTTAFPIGNSEVEDLLKNCATCSAQFDNIAMENYLIYKTDTGTFQQTFYPDIKSTTSKVNYANENGLTGLAVWALGYEAQSGSILNPLKNFLSHY